MKQHGEKSTRKARTTQNIKQRITGKSIYITEPMDPKRGQGEIADHFFMTSARLAALDFIPAVGQTIEIFYNRFGKVSTLRLLDDDNVAIA